MRSGVSKASSQMTPIFLSVRSVNTVLRIVSVECPVESRLRRLFKGGRLRGPRKSQGRPFHFETDLGMVNLWYRLGRTPWHQPVAQTSALKTDAIPDTSSSNIQVSRFAESSREAMVCQGRRRQAGCVEGWIAVEENRAFQECPSTVCASRHKFCSAFSFCMLFLESKPMCTKPSHLRCWVCCTPFSQSRPVHFVPA